MRIYTQLTLFKFPLILPKSLLKIYLNPSNLYEFSLNIPPKTFYTTRESLQYLTTSSSELPSRPLKRRQPLECHQSPTTISPTAKTSLTAGIANDHGRRHLAIWIKIDWLEIYRTRLITILITVNNIKLREILNECKYCV